MKILYIAHRIPFPPNKGEKIRAFNQLKYLNERHDVFLCFFVDNYCDLKFTQNLNSYALEIYFEYIRTWYTKCKALVASIFSQKPLTLRCFYSRSFRKKINELLQREKFDIVIASCSSVAQYVPANFAPKVLDLIDIDSDKWVQYEKFAHLPKSYIYKLEASRMKKYEEYLIRNWNQCYVISKQEANVLSEEYSTKLNVLANGVDLKYFQKTCFKDNPNKKNDVVFVGTMNYFPNKDAMLFFCKHIWPLVIKSCKQATLYIVGRDPSPSIYDLQSENIIVTGTVDDISIYLQKAKIGIAPVRIARGVQNKVLEYIVSGLPCVLSPQAAEGIDLSNINEGVWIEKETENFANRIIHCLNNPTYIPERERKEFAQKYTWEHHLQKWEKELLQIAKGINRG